MATNKTSRSGYTTGVGNLTLLENPELCTLDTCELDLSSFYYIPTLSGNAVIAAIFGVMMLIQIGLGIRYKTWGYMAAMILGLLLECVGYIGRILISKNPFNGDAFLQSLVCLTIAPALLTAAIYLCLGRIVHLFGSHLSYFKPRTYTIVFCTFDFICLVLQAAGGAIASTSNTAADNDTGRKIMIGGLIFQVVALFLFMAVSAFYGVSVFRGRGTWNPQYTDVTRSALFRLFLAGLVVATLAIQARCIYRCIELWQGFDSDLFMGHEDVFMALEAAMILLACACLTFLHPGVAFQGTWGDADFHFRTKKRSLLKSSGSDDEQRMTQVELRERGTGYAGSGYKAQAYDARA